MGRQEVPLIRWVSYQTMLGVMIQAPFAIGTFHFYFYWHPFKTELKSEMAYIVFLNMIKSPDLSPGMSLITVMAIFIPNWSNLQLIGSAVTFIQVGIYKLWGIRLNNIFRRCLFGFSSQNLHDGC